MLSFLIVFNKNRNYLVQGALNNIKKYYNEKKEIILAELDENEVFRLGQMRNLAFKKSIGDILIFLDVDIRFKNKIDFIETCKTVKQPYLPWNRIINVKEEKENLIEIEERQYCLGGYGGCFVHSRKQFEQSKGFSNLMAGWGGEDNIFNERMPLTRLEGIVYHVIHSQDSISGCGGNLAIRNRTFWQTDKTRDKNEDSYIQTIADESLIYEDNEIKHYLFKNIRVSENYKYYELYKELESLIRI